MRKVLAKNPQVEQQRLHRRVFLENINPENQALMVSPFRENVTLFSLKVLLCNINFQFFVILPVIFVRMF